MSLLSAHQMKMTKANCLGGAISDSSTAEEKNPGMANGQYSPHDELLTRTYKFLEVVNTTIQHLQIQGISLCF